MHEGCEGSLGNGGQIVNKLRQMGFSQTPLPVPAEINCACNSTFTMSTMEGRCDNCGMVYGVTPCHANDPANIEAAGINY